MAAAAIPLAISAGGYIASAIAKKKAKSSAMQLTPEEQGYYGKASGAGDQQMQLADVLRGQGTDLFNTGSSGLKQATGYYSTLLNGNRSAMQQAVAPETGAINDAYAGANSALEHGGVRGATRDQQTGELAREKAGKISGLLGGVRPAAANALATTGLAATGQGTGALSAASGATSSGAGIFQGLIGSRGLDRMNANSAGDKSSSNVGALTAQVLKIYADSKTGGGSSKGGK